MLVYLCTGAYTQRIIQTFQELGFRCVVRHGVAISSFITIRHVQTASQNQNSSERIDDVHAVVVRAVLHVFGIETGDTGFLAGGD